MSRYEAADRHLGARLRPLDAVPPADLEASFASIQARRGAVDKAPNLLYYYRRRALVAAFCLLGIGLAGAWWGGRSDDSGRSVSPSATTMTTTAPDASAAVALPASPDRTAEARSPIATAEKTPNTAPARNAPKPTAATNMPVANTNARIISPKNNPTATRAAATTTRNAVAAPPTLSGPAATSDRALISEASTSAETTPPRRPAVQLRALPALDYPELAVYGDPKVDCARFRIPADWRTQVELLSGPQLSIRTIQARQSEDDIYAYRRRTTERPWYVATTQVRVSLRSSRGWVFRTGLSLTDRHERLDYAGNDTERIQIETVYSPDGSPLRTDTLRQIGRRVVQWDNRHRRLDVPLLIGYGWKRHPFDLHVNAGALLNVWNRPTGRHLTAQGEIVSDWSEQRTRLAPEVYLSLGFNYRFLSRWTVQLEPHARYGFASVTTPGAPLRRYYGAVGVLTGLRYQF